MDHKQEGYESSSVGGVRRLNRVLARYDGETHLYQYLPEQTEQAVRVVKLHVEDGRLHPYAGIILVKMIREADDDD